MDTMMLAWVFGVPVFLLVMVLVLDRLESFVITPIDRAQKIQTLVEAAPPEVVEQQVSVLLAPVVSRDSSSFSGQAEASA